MNDSAKPKKTPVKRRSPRDLLQILLPSLLITAAAFYAAFQFVEPAPPRQITMAAGAKDGAYYRVAQRYQEVLAKEGITLDLLETAGSGENLELLQQTDGKVQIALLQGGAGRDGKAAGVQSLGSVFYEPLWIFWRGKPADTLVGLKGKRIAMGAQGSGTNEAIGDMLEANGLASDDFVASEISGDDAAQALLDGDVDVAGFVSEYTAPHIQKLLLSDGIHLMPINRAGTYQRKFDYLSRVVAPRGMASLERDLPPRDVPLIAMVANLGAAETLHPALVALLLGAATEIHSAPGMFAQSRQFPSVENVTLPMNPDAKRYLLKGPPFLQRFLPFWLAIAIDRLVVLLIPLVTLLFPLFKILPPAYRWRVRSRIFRYYRELLAVETVLHNNPDTDELDRCAEQLQGIENKINEVSVPPSYADNLYNLRLHLKLVNERLEQARVEAGV
jgi:TRAP transporter TAXI family solute receptor